MQRFLFQLVRPGARALMLCTAIATTSLAVRAAELDGVRMPDTVQIDGTTLQLNGYGVRTYSILGIHIYTAGLYLEHLSTDPNDIIDSPETKLLTIRFERAVSADQSRDAWRTALANNCVAPCQLDPGDLESFLAQVPAMRAGEYFHLLFTRNGAVVSADGRQIGVISRRQFANAMLATFLGPHPGSPELRRDLLRGHS